MYIARARVFNDLLDENPPQIYWTTVDPATHWEDDDLLELPSGSIVIQVDGTGGRDDVGTDLVQIWKKITPTPTVVDYNGARAFRTLAPAVIVSEHEPIGDADRDEFCMLAPGSIVIMEDGGYYNAARIKIRNLCSPLGVGDWRQLPIVGTYGTVMVGGTDNEITDSAENAVVLGGHDNWTRGDSAVAVGGEENEVGGDRAVVLGSRFSTTTNYDCVAVGGSRHRIIAPRSIGIGSKCHTSHSGAILISPIAGADATAATDEFDSAAIDEFAVRANGIRLLTNLAESAGVTMAAGGSSWVTVSDQRAKNGIELLDEEVAERYLNLDIVRYTMGEEEIGAGVTAQNYYEAFPFLPQKRVGEMYALTQAERDGIQDAAIKQLVRRVQLLEQENTMLRGRLDAIETRLARLEG